MDTLAILHQHPHRCRHHHRRRVRYSLPFRWLCYRICVQYAIKLKRRYISNEAGNEDCFVYAALKPIGMHATFIPTLTNEASATFSQNSIVKKLLVLSFRCWVYLTACEDAFVYFVNSVMGRIIFLRNCGFSLLACLLRWFVSHCWHWAYEVLNALGA